jgi:multidrug efflux pump subunit AcrA (membrane-fusion protein)
MVTVDTTAPEVADVLTAMPWWAARGLLYLVVAFVVVALCWAGFSPVDIVVEARGRLVPEGEVQTVEAPQAGAVRAVLVREGNRVGQGAVLVELDSPAPHTDREELAAELTTGEQRLEQLQAAGAPIADVLEQKALLNRLRRELRAAELSQDRTQIRAPVNGVIASLDVPGAGAVVEQGSRIATIVPKDARLVAEVQVPNKDVAFVAPGRRAKVKIDAFPYQDYGTITGKVNNVSSDARADERFGSFYKVTITLDQKAFRVGGQSLSLRSGLTLTAGIVTERKSVLSLLLDPFRKVRGAMDSVPA